MRGDKTNIYSLNKKSKIAELDEAIISFKNSIDQPQLAEKRTNWSENERIRLLNGLIRYSQSNLRWYLIKTDLSYGLYLSRYAKNAHHDGFKSILKGNFLFYLLKKAINWSIKDFPLHEHFSSLNVVIPENEAVRTIYSDLYAVDSLNFRSITIEDFDYFYNTFLNRKHLSLQEYNFLRNEMISQKNVSLAMNNSFINAVYRPIEIDRCNSEDFTILRRPRFDVDNLSINTIPQTSKSTNSNCLSCADLKEKLDSTKNEILFLINTLESRMTGLESVKPTYSKLCSLTEALSTCSTELKSVKPAFSKFYSLIEALSARITKLEKSKPAYSELYSSIESLSARITELESCRSANNLYKSSFNSNVCNEVDKSLNSSFGNNDDFGLVHNYPNESQANLELVDVCSSRNDVSKPLENYNIIEASEVSKHEKEKIYDQSCDSISSHVNPIDQDSKPPVLNENSKDVQDLPSLKIEETSNNVNCVIERFKEKIKAKYKNNFFTKSSARGDLFTPTKRPSITELTDIIARLCDEKFLETIKTKKNNNRMYTYFKVKKH